LTLDPGWKRLKNTALYDSIFYLSSSSFDFDTYPTFYSDADLDPASQNDADPDLQHRSGPKYVRTLLVHDKKSQQNTPRDTFLQYVVVLLCCFCYITIAGCVDIGYLIIFRR
jgi:hypothetical protein